MKDVAAMPVPASQRSGQAAVHDGVPQNNRRRTGSLHSYPLPEQALQHGAGAKDGITVFKINKVRACLRKY